MGRWQLVQAILLFAGAPLYTVMLALAAVSGGDRRRRRRSRPRPAAGADRWRGRGAIYAPKLLGYAEVLLSAPTGAPVMAALRRVRRPGRRLEIVFTLLLDAIAQLQQDAARWRGWRWARAPDWLPQNRAERGVGWGEAARLFWPHTLFGVAVFALLASLVLGWRCCGRCRSPAGCWWRFRSAC